LMAKPGRTPTSPLVIVTPPAKFTADREYTASFPHTVVLAREVGAIEVVGGLLGAGLGLFEIDGLELGTELGAIDDEGGDEIDGLVLGRGLGKGMSHGSPIVAELAMPTAVFAMAQPFNVAPTPTAMELPARMDPSRTLLAPRAAAVPSTQRIFFAFAPPVKMTEVSAPVVKVVPAIKINSASASPSPSKVTWALTAKLMAVPKRYTPGVNIRPPI
jgi:hypothetical protein